MTLCVAYKNDEGIHLISDSQMTYQNGDTRSRSYTAMKVIPLPIKISGLTTEEFPEPLIEFQSVMGLAFAGDFATLNAVKDFLAVVLQRLQTIPQRSRLNINQIFSFIAEVYERIALRLFCDLSERTLIDFFLCGICPQTRTPSLAQYRIDPESGDSPIPSFDVYTDSKDFPLAIGCGDDDFMREWSRTDEPRGLRNVFCSVAKVIADPTAVQVGGPIQYGQCTSENSFQLLGTNFEPGSCPDENGYSRYGLYIGGMNLDSIWQKEDMNLYVTGRYVDMARILEE
jgi:hypothetical protein